MKTKKSNMALIALTTFLAISSSLASAEDIVIVHSIVPPGQESPLSSTDTDTEARAQYRAKLDQDSCASNNLRSAEEMAQKNRTTIQKDFDRIVSDMASIAPGVVPEVRLHVVYGKDTENAAIFYGVWEVTDKKTGAPIEALLNSDTRYDSSLYPLSIADGCKVSSEATQQLLVDLHEFTARIDRERTEADDNATQNDNGQFHKRPPVGIFVNTKSLSNRASAQGPKF